MQELYGHLKAVAKYVSVAAINRLEALELPGPDADRIHSEAAQWERVARELRLLASTVQEDIEHTTQLKRCMADGTNEFVRLMGEARRWSHAMNGGRRPV
jgi:hypothetical protein